MRLSLSDYRVVEDDDEDGEVELEDGEAGMVERPAAAQPGLLVSIFPVVASRQLASVRLVDEPAAAPVGASRETAPEDVASGEPLWVAELEPLDPVDVAAPELDDAPGAGFTAPAGPALCAQAGAAVRATTAAAAAKANFMGVSFVDRGSAPRRTELASPRSVLAPLPIVIARFGGEPSRRPTRGRISGPVGAGQRGLAFVRNRVDALARRGVDFGHQAAIDQARQERLALYGGDIGAIVGDGGDTHLPTALGHGQQTELAGRQGFKLRSDGHGATLI